MIEITVTPSGHGRFCAWLGDPANGGRVIAEAREPYFTAARRLVLEGFNLDEDLCMRHHGSTTIALVMPLRQAAGLTVREREDGGSPTIVRWRASPYGAGAPPIERKGRGPLDSP